MVYTASEERYDSMLYNYCGQSGLKLPGISLGLWQNFGDDFNEQVSRELFVEKPLIWGSRILIWPTTMGLLQGQRKIFSAGY